MGGLGEIYADDGSLVAALRSGDERAFEFSVLEQFRETVRLARRIREQDVDELDPTLRAELMAAFRDVVQRRGDP